MTSTITITATPLFSADRVIITLMALEITLMVLTIFVAVIAIVGVDYIKRSAKAAEKVALLSAQEIAQAKVKELFEKSPISDIIKQEEKNDA